MGMYDADAAVSLLWAGPGALARDQQCCMSGDARCPADPRDEEQDARDEVENEGRDEREPVHVEPLYRALVGLGQLGDLVPHERVD